MWGMDDILQPIVNRPLRSTVTDLADSQSAADWQSAPQARSPPWN